MGYPRGFDLDIWTALHKAPDFTLEVAWETNYNKSMAKITSFGASSKISMVTGQSDGIFLLNMLVEFSYLLYCCSMDHRPSKF